MIRSCSGLTFMLSTPSVEKWVDLRVSSRTERLPNICRPISSVNGGVPEGSGSLRLSFDSLRFSAGGRRAILGYAKAAEETRTETSPNRHQAAGAGACGPDDGGTLRRSPFRVPGAVIRVHVGTRETW